MTLKRKNFSLKEKKFILRLNCLSIVKIRHSNTLFSTINKRNVFSKLIIKTIKTISNLNNYLASNLRADYLTKSVLAISEGY